MKSLFSKVSTLIAVGLVVFSLATPAVAQSSTTSSSMRVNVPFAFLAGNHMNSAGEYWITVDKTFNRISLRPAAETHSQFAGLSTVTLKRRNVEEGTGVLRFVKYGDRYALRCIWANGATYGNELTLSKAEKEMASVSGGAAVTAEVTSIR